MIKTYPEWQSSMSKGVKSVEDRIDPISAAESFLEDQHKKRLGTNNLELFCRFLLSELNIAPLDIESALVKELVVKFERQRS